MKRKWILCIVLGLIVTPVAILLVTGWRYYPGIIIDKMRSIVDKEIPLGTQRTDVERFLSQRRIEYSYVERENRIYAIVRDTCRGILIECSIDMVFGFDGQRVLISSSVKEGFTGP